MPIGITSPAKNLFLIGSTGASSTQDFLNRITPDGADSNQITPTSILYDDTNQELYIAGTQRDATSASSEGFIYNTSDEAPITIDFTVKLKAGDSFSNVVFNALCYDSNLNLYAAGSWDDGTTPTTNRNYAPTLSKFNSAGEHQWTITPVNATGDLDQIVFNDVCADTYGNVYVTGVGNDSDKLYIAKYDTYGTVLWYKSYTDQDLDSFYNFEGRSIDINSQNELVIVGTALGPAKYMSVMLKVSTDGALLWDKTIEIGEDPTTNFFQLTDVHIDGNDQIYLCGHDDAFLDGTYESYVIKMTKEGNMLWQTKTKEPNKDIFYQEISVDTLTGQSIVAGYVEEATNAYQIIQRYDNAGKLIWTRKIQSPNNQASSTTMSSDPSYYYIAFADQTSNAADPTSFLFGKLSVTGSGLGDFNYSDGAAVQTYEIITINTETATLRDGSLRNDSSDFITYPFSPIKVVFGENAGGNLIYSDKKPQHETNTHDITFASETIIQSSVPPVSASDISRGNALLLNYEFDNEFTYDRAENLANNSETFENWTANGSRATITPNQIVAPDGSLTADMIEDANSGSGNKNLYQYITITSTETYTASLYVKAGTSDWANWYFDDTNVSFQFSTETISLDPNSGNLGGSGTATAGFDNVGNGWYRLYLKDVYASSGSRPFGIWTGANSQTYSPAYVGDPQYNFYIWGAQVEQGSTLGRYIRTTGTAITAPTTVENLVSSSYTGTINGATFNSAGYFEFDNDYIDAGYSIPTNNFTVETWFKKTDTTYWSPVWACEVWNQSSGYLLYFDGNNVLELTTGGNSTGPLQVNTIGNMTDWRHLVLTIDGSNVATIYQNGFSLGSTTITPVGSIQKPLRIGARFSNDGNGSADGRQTQSGELRAYNIALSATEIVKNFNATCGKYGLPLYAGPPIISSQDQYVVAKFNLDSYQDQTSDPISDSGPNSYQILQTGTVAPYVISNTDSPLNNGNNYISKPGTGENGAKGFYFNNSQFTQAVHDNIFTSGTDWSFSWWGKFNYSGSGFKTFYIWGQRASTGMSIDILTNSTTNYTLRITAAVAAGNTGASISIPISTLYTDNTWAHFVVGWKAVSSTSGYPYVWVNGNKPSTGLGSGTQLYNLPIVGGNQTDFYRTFSTTALLWHQFSSEELSTSVDDFVIYNVIDPWINRDPQYFVPSESLP